MFTLGHVSDWHTTQLEGASVRELFGKRFFGWLSWQMRRQRLHQQPVLDALFADLTAQAPDHVAITGDLGFADPSYFVRFFRRSEGMTPSRFRHHAGTRPAPN